MGSSSMDGIHLSLYYPRIVTFHDVKPFCSNRSQLSSLKTPLYLPQPFCLPLRYLSQGQPLARSH